jgi:hypothetical protein
MLLAAVRPAHTPSGPSQHRPSTPLPKHPNPQTLKDQLAAAGRGIDFIVVSHTEPDHSFLVPAVRLPGFGGKGAAGFTSL